MADNNKKIMFVFGTRPEAIKVAPLILKFQENKSFEPFVCVLRQHKEVTRILSSFGIKPDVNIGIELSDRGVFSNKNPLRKLIKLARSGFGLLKLYKLLGKKKPDLLLVQGDTSTAFLAAFMAFNKKIEVGHIEAGLRTHNKYAPFPEEMNRQLIGRIAEYHFAPTDDAKENLLKENIDESKIFVVGNTALDAARIILEKEENGKEISKEYGDKFVLVTAHRRESFGKGLENICEAILELARKHPEINFVYPVHPNPNVREVVYKKLKGIENIRLIDPVKYEDFIHLMEKSYFLLTDSGGIQEEVSLLGKPCLVMREKTERQEGIEAGNVGLVGTEKERIAEEVEELLNNKEKYESMAKKHDRFGDGHASEKIVEKIEESYSK